MDQRSQDNINTLNPKARPWFVALLAAFAPSLKANEEVRIISGNRTYAEQDALYRKKPKVTNARGGQSNHNFGLAVDIGIFRDGKYIPEDPLYAKLGPIGEKLGLEWGGRWRSMPDEPHYQIKTGLTRIAQVRDVFESGKIASLIPEYKAGAVAVAPIPTGPAELTPVAVYEKDERTGVKAYLWQNRTIVAARAFTEEFGGLIESADSDSITFLLHGEEHELKRAPTPSSDPSVGFVYFSDLNAILGYAYSFVKGNLVIIPSEDGS